MSKIVEPLTRRDPLPDEECYPRMFKLRHIFQQ